MKSAPAADVKAPDFVQSLARGLDVILAFSHHRPRLSLSEVAEVTGLSRPTARRMLLTLEEIGYVRREGRAFALTPRVLALGYAYLSSLDLTEIAQPVLERVVAETREGCSLSTLDDTEVVYVTRVPTRQVASFTLATGTRLPAHATSMGHVLLAGLPEAELERYVGRADFAPMTARTIRDAGELRERLETVRGQGWAMVDQELEVGLRSIAAPVRDADGRTIAALGLSSTTLVTDVQTMRATFVPILVGAAEEVSAALGEGFGRVQADA